MLKVLLSLVRVKQWYKNLLIFLPLIFAGQAFIQTQLVLSVIGFIALCLAYGAIYIFNDLQDLKKDREHSDKSNRPIASGKIKPQTASAIALLLIAISLIAAYSLSFNFLLVLFVIIAVNTLYSLFLKRFLFIDILTISALLVLRAVSGAILIAVTVSPWLLLCTFLLALFLAISKRRGDFGHYKESYRKGESYTVQELDLLLAISISSLLVAYSIYAFFTHTNFIFWLSVPIAFFIGFRFLHLAMTNHKAALKAEEIFYERQILIAMAIWIITAIAGIYGG